MTIIKNAVKDAVERLGGATKVAVKTESSSWSVHHWVRIGRIPRYAKAAIVADLSGIPLVSLWQRRQSADDAPVEVEVNHVEQ